MKDERPGLGSYLLVCAAITILGVAGIVSVERDRARLKQDRYLPNSQVSYHVTSSMHVVCLGGLRYWARNGSEQVVGPVIDPQTLTYKRCTEQGE